MKSDFVGSNEFQSLRSIREVVVLPRQPINTNSDRVACEVNAYQDNRLMIREQESCVNLMDNNKNKMRRHIREAPLSSISLESR